MGLGCATFWVFSWGFLFFSATKILAAVAVTSHQVKSGALLLLGSFVSLVVCGLVFLGLAVSAAKAAASEPFSVNGLLVAPLPVPQPLPKPAVESGEKAVPLPASKPASKKRFAEPDEIRVVIGAGILGVQ